MNLQRKRMQREKEGRTWDYVRIGFDSWSEFLTFAERAKTPMPLQERASRRVKDDDLEWTGTRTFEEALELAAVGWQKEAKSIRALSTPLFEVMSSLIDRQTITYQVEGRSIDVARFVQNEPECWQEFVEEIAEGHGGNRIVRLVFNQGASCNISAQTIQRRGVAAVSLIELLEFAGFRVEVMVGTSCEGDQNLNWETYIKLKDASQPMDLPRLTYALAHPSMLRRLCFSTWEAMLTEPELKRANIWPSCGYGSVGELIETGDIYIGGGNFDMENPQAWILEQLKLSGVRLVGDLPELANKKGE